MRVRGSTLPGEEQFRGGILEGEEVNSDGGEGGRAALENNLKLK
jgi:hypothetical protein